MNLSRFNLPISEFDDSLEDKRFKRILLWVILSILVVGLIVPFLPVFEVEREVKEKIPPRIAKVLMEKKQAPPPPPPIKKPATKKPDPEKVIDKKKAPPKKVVKKTPPQVKKKKSVQERVAKVGLLALKNQLLELREDPVLNRIARKDRKLTKNVKSSSKPTRASVIKNTTKGSGGIDVSKLSKKTTHTTLAKRTLSKVTTDIQTGGEDKPLGKENIKGRSLESIRLVIERVKGSLQTLYMRQLRKTPGIQGTVLFDFTIASSGEVVSCKIVESELNSPRLERKFVIKLKSINFGEEDVGEVLIRYPLDFLPSLSMN